MKINNKTTLKTGVMKLLCAWIGLLVAPAETASAGIFVNDGTGGSCAQMQGLGVLGIQIPITIVSNGACNASSLSALVSSGASTGTLALNSHGAFLIGNLSISGALDVNNNPLHNLANGVAASDAINLSQLSASATATANILGGGASVNVDGTLSVPSYMVQNSTRHDVGSALSALDSGVTTNAATISGLDTRVSSNEGMINSLVGGTTGLVQQADASAPITLAASSGGAVVNVAGTDGDRRISGVADGTDDNDAANWGQVKAITTQLADLSALAVAYDDATQTSITLGGKGAASPVLLHNVADGLNDYDAVNVGQLTRLQTSLQGQIDTVSSQVGALDGRVSTLENNADASPPVEQAPLPDNGGNLDTTQGVAVGNNSAAGTDSAAAVGQNAQAAGEHGTAIGGDAYAASYHATALGGNAAAMADSAVAVGADAMVNAGSGTALGEGASVTATATNAVALGAGSIATQANSVSVGSAGNERTITNVAAGVNATDAVNVSQLQAAQSWAQSYTDQQANALNTRITRMGQRADAGTAASIAMTNIPQAYAPEQSSLGAGIGGFRGQAAVAVGMSTVTPGGRWVIKASLSGSTQGDIGVGAGAAMVW